MLREADVIQKADEIAGETGYYPKNRKLRDVALVVAAGVLSGRTANSDSPASRAAFLASLSRTLARPLPGSVGRPENTPPGQVPNVD